MYSLIVTAKMNNIDPQTWLADVLARIADHSAQRLDDLLPWKWEAAKVSALDLGRLALAAPSCAYTIARVARMLGQDEALLERSP